MLTAQVGWVKGYIIKGNDGLGSAHLAYMQEKQLLCMHFRKTKGRVWANVRGWQRLWRGALHRTTGVAIDSWSLLHHISVFVYPKAIFSK